MDNKVQMAKEDRETNLKKNEAVDVKGKNAQVNSPKSLNSSKFDPLAACKEKPPFPQALMRPKKDNHFSEIMELFKKVHINIPLLEAIRQIPSYAKFLKGLCSHKRKLNGEEKVFLTKKLSDIYLRKNPSKLKDPGIPTLCCAIGSHKFEEALVDHGASVNLMPYSVYVELGLGELKRSPITLEFADGYVKKSCGVIEDVLMQIDKFYYPMDFIVLDTGAMRYSSTEIPIILGRPFLATAKANIQCDTGVLTLYFGNMKAKFDLYPAPGLQSGVDHVESIRPAVWAYKKD